jgi:PAS domain S-box-containing protein
LDETVPQRAVVGGLNVERSPQNPELSPEAIAAETGPDRRRHFDLSLDLLCIAGLDGFFKQVNPSWTRVLGWSQAELFARPVVDFMHPEDRERTLLARASLAKGIPVQGLENRYLCKDGSFRWLSWQSTIEPNGTTVFAVARDVTDRRKIEHDQLILGKLESTGILAGGIAHDFNNLLSSLMLNLEMIAVAGSTSQQQQRHIDQALESARAAHGITQQLLTFASGGESTLRSSDLKAVLIPSLDIALLGSNSRGRYELAPDLWPAEINVDQITQVIRNLALNAREAMPDGGVVLIRAENLVVDSSRGLQLNPGNYVRICVIDEGVGIQAAVLPKVFDPYFSTKQRGMQRGMGLGLTICHSIIRKHGGQITIDSHPGQGTSVSFYLPAAGTIAATQDIPSAVAPTSSPVRAHKILIMDDEETMRNILVQALTQFGYQVKAAKNGEEALALYQQADNEGQSFDLVLLDLTVKGGLGGAETLKLLLQQDPTVCALLMSGYNQEKTFRDYAQHGFRAALAKPFSVAKLRAVLSDALRAA